MGEEGYAKYFARGEVDIVGERVLSCFTWTSGTEWESQRFEWGEEPCRLGRMLLVLRCVAFAEMGGCLPFPAVVGRFFVCEEALLGRRVWVFVVGLALRLCLEGSTAPQLKLCTEGLAVVEL